MYKLTRNDIEGYELDVAKRLYMLNLFDEWRSQPGDSWEPVEQTLQRNAYIFADDYDGKHDGDCVKQPATCFLCVREMWVEKARKLIATQGDAMSDMFDALDR